MPKVEKSREQMIECVVEDLKDWLERDAYGFWQHVQELERADLKEKSDKELEEIYES